MEFFAACDGFMEMKGAKKRGYDAQSIRADSDALAAQFDAQGLPLKE